MTQHQFTDAVFFGYLFYGVCLWIYTIHRDNRNNKP